MKNLKNKYILDFLSKLIRVSPRDSLKLMILSVLAALTESVGFAILLPTLNALESRSGNIFESSNLLMSSSKFATESVFNIVVISLSCLLCLFAVISYLRTMDLNKLEWKISCLEAEELFCAITNSEWAETLRHRKSDLTELLIRETRQVGFAFVQVSNMLSSAVAFLLLIAVSLFVSVPFTLLSLGLGMSIVLVTKGLNRQALVAGQASFAAYQRIYAECEEHLESLPLIKIFGSEQTHIQNFINYSKNVAKNSEDYVRARARTALYYKFLTSILLTLTAIISVQLELLSISQFLLLAALFSRITPHVLTLQHAYQTFLNSIPSYLILKNTVVSFQSKNEFERANTENRNCFVNTKSVSGIHLEHVSYKYPLSASINALGNVNLILPQTGLLLLKGESGSGKSTFARLISGLLLPTSGTIRLGSEIVNKKNLHLWRKLISYVPQEITLSYSTVRETLLASNTDASDNDLWKVLNSVSLPRSNKLFVNGLDTVIGNGGCLLSGGERQRISIARALLRKPKIIIFDEATNSLDQENEAIVHSVFNEIKNYSLVILISHQPIPNHLVDNILWFQNGTVIVDDASIGNRSMNAH